MATDDRQVLVTGQASAPAQFKVPGNGQIRPKAVTAHYDGTSAAGDFLPALKITSDAGEVVGVFPTEATVAAGASARVSWFPGVKPGAATTGTASLPCAFADITNAFVLAAWGGFYTPVTWDLVNPNDATVFSWPSGGDATKIHIAKDGYYRFAYEYQTNGTNFPAAPGTIISQVFTTVTGSTREVPSVNASTGDLYRGDQTANPPWGPISERVFRLGAAQDVQLFMAWQAAAGTATINTVVAFIYRLGNLS